jgi:hypothetical protein
MMAEDQYRKLVRRFNVVLTVSILTAAMSLIALALVFIFSPRTETRYITGERGDPGQSIIGPQGPAGQAIVGERGPAGNDGVDGQTVINEKQTVIERRGEPGPKGDSGAPGREIELQRNQDTGDVEWRYDGDSFWQVLLPVCEVTQTCEVANGSTD